MKPSDIFLLLIIVVLSILLGGLLGAGIKQDIIEKKAIAAGVGYYNPTNAHFQFITVTNK